MESNGIKNAPRAGGAGGGGKEGAHGGRVATCGGTGQRKDEALQVLRFSQSRAQSVSRQRFVLSR